MKAELRAYSRLTREQRKWARETLLFLLLARLAARRLPFARVRSWIEQPVRRPAPGDVERAYLQSRVREMIRYTNRWLGVGAVCYPQALAAHAMLRRRGIDSTLHYGRCPDGGRTGHMWLEAHGENIVGHEGREDAELKPVASFSALPAPSRENGSQSIAQPRA